MRDLLPVRYFLPPSAPKYDQYVFVNWLNVEVDPTAEIRMPILRRISGQRNREVYVFVKYSYEDFMNRWYSC